MSFYSKDDTDPSAKNGKGLFQTEFGYYRDNDFYITGFYGGVDTFNFDQGVFEKDQELDLITGKIFKINEDVNLGIAFNIYNYFSNKSNNMIDYGINISYKMLKLEVSYIPNYSGFATSDLYSKVSAKVPFSDTLGLNLTAAYSSIGDEEKIGMTSYSDYKIGAYFNPYPFLGSELFYTTTSGRKILYLNETMNDSTVTLSIFGTIGF